MMAIRIISVWRSVSSSLATWLVGDVVVAGTTVERPPTAHCTRDGGEPWMKVIRACREASGSRWARIGESPIGKWLYCRCLKDTSMRPGHHIGNIHLEINK